MRLRFACVLLSGLFLAAAARAKSVDVALVLASDVSRSIDAKEYQLEKEGYARALESQPFMDAIKAGPSGAIAIAYLEFSGEADAQVVLSWATIRDPESAHNFAARLVAAPRSSSGLTAIGAALEQALGLFAQGGVESARRVVDVCGDGTSNDGPDVVTMRDKAVAAGVTINGLTIINESSSYFHMHPPGGLTQYYRENVVGGVGSFVVEVHGFAAIGDAMVRKLVSEVAANPAGRQWAGIAP